jgi:hypothetical protein
MSWVQFPSGLPFFAHFGEEIISKDKASNGKPYLVLAKNMSMDA